MGFNQSFAPTIGTTVLVWFPGGKLGYIIGSSPSSSYIDRLGVSRRMTTGGKGEVDNAQYANQQIFEQLRQRWHKHESKDLHSNRFNYGGQPAGDLAEGEVDISNIMGVGLQLIRHFAILKGGDFAKVECSIIDDMVRIIR